MPAARRAAILLRHERPRKGRIADHAQALAQEPVLQRIEHLTGGRCAEPVAQHHLGAPLTGAGHGIQRLMRHGMEIQKHRLAKPRLRGAHQPIERRMIGLPDLRDARLGLGAGDLAAINRAPIGHDTGNHPQPRRYARRLHHAAHALDHAGVKLIGAAVQIDPGARIFRRDQGRAQCGSGADQLIHIGVFRRPHHARIQNTGLQERRRIMPPGMRRGHNHRRQQLIRTFKAKGRVHARSGTGCRKIHITPFCTNPKALEPLTQSFYRPVTQAAGCAESGHPALVTLLSSRARAVSSAVEHYVDIVGVTGSIPVPPTMNRSARTKRNHQARRPRRDEGDRP